MSMRDKKLPIAALERIDDLCAAFEQKWQADEPPSIEASLSGEFSQIERDALLAELIALDVDYRRRRGETPTEQAYRERFPSQTQAIRDALDAGGKPTGVFKPPTVAQLGELFPSLEIIELIGAGGMGAVYKARQEGIDRMVAIKILPEELGHDVKFALRFTREARTLAKLSHPNIVALYEFGNVNGTYFFLMEYVPGSTLRDVVQSGELAPEHALAIVPQLCDALQYAHDQGVIHRDIKPENILMSVDGTVKIADFGLARLLGDDSQLHSLTATHQVMGTLRYMAPEQLESTHSVDHRADIYSMGVVIYEMLTGELPLGRFAAPSSKAPIDARLDDVVLRTLEKEPQLRYQSASDVKSDVQSITLSEASAYAVTAVHEKNPDSAGHTASAATLEQQELAGRLLLTRRRLLDRVESALKPLVRGELIQIAIGVILILLGAQCWARSSLTHRIICGAIVHVYGVIVIAQAALVCTRIRQIDYSKPVEEIRSKLDRVRSGYLLAGVVIGFSWWLMWIPVCVAIGFDAVVTYRNSLIPSLLIGVVGLVVSLWLYWRALRPGNASSDQWKKKLSGESIAAAYLALEEIENARIS